MADDNANTNTTPAEDQLSKDSAAVEEHLMSLEAPPIEDAPTPAPAQKTEEKPETKPKANVESPEIEIRPTDQEPPASPAPTGKQQEEEEEEKPFTPLSDDEVENQYKRAPKQLRDGYKRMAARIKELESSQSSPESHPSFASLKEQHDKTAKELAQLRDQQAEVAPPPFDPNADDEIVSLKQRHNTALGDHRKDLGGDGPKIERDMQQLWPAISQTDFSDSASVSKLEDALDDAGFEDPAAVRRYLKEYTTRNAEVTALQQKKEEGWLGSVADRYKSTRESFHGEITGLFQSVQDSDIKSNPLKADHILAHHVKNNPALQQRLDEVATEYETQHLGLEPVTDPASLTAAEKAERAERNRAVLEVRKNLHVARAKGQIALELLPAMQKEINRLRARAGESAKEHAVPVKDGSDNVPPPPKAGPGASPYRVALTSPEDLEKDSLNPNAIETN